MTTRVTALIAAAGLAAVGAWFKTKGRRKLLPRLEDEFGAEFALEPPAPVQVEIDDDEAAEIIRRARPALERARQVM